MKEDSCHWRLAVLALAVFIPGFAAGCGSGPRPVVDGTGASKLAGELQADPLRDPRAVVATVNGVEITAGEMFRRFLQHYGTRRYIEGLVSMEVVEQEARRRGITVTPEEAARLADEQLEEEARQAGGKEELERQYDQFGSSMADARAERAREMEPRLLAAKVVKSMRPINEDVLRAYYQATYAKTGYAVRHIAFSYRPEKWHTETDLPRLKLEAHNRALRVADQARKGADFAELARTESQDPVSAGRGGDLGVVRDVPGPPDYLRAVFKLAQGDVSDPVENPLGAYHVFQVTAIVPSESFASCEEKMRRELMQAEPSDDEIRAAMMKLVSQSRVELFPQGLAAPPEANKAAKVQVESK